ncbi:MAG TPA: outer membrane beta-barrel protein [Polyangiaceae bacterium]|jgi:hypothetical protein
MSRSFALLAALVASLPLRALGADTCPDGWFCDQTPQPAPPPEAMPAEPEPFDEPPPPDVRVDRPEDGEWESQPEQRSMRHRPRAVQVHREWGFNLHLNQALIGHDSRFPNNSGMGGFGLALRYRFVPRFALESSLEWAWGRDYQGFSRDETAVLVNGLVFFNPKDVVQVYAFGGLGVGTADVNRSSSGIGTVYLYPGGNQRYWYLGVQAGLGMDVRVNRRVALTADLLGILRGRVDDNANFSPEFVDPNTHRVTNTSGAGLFRLGATFYW